MLRSNWGCLVSTRKHERKFTARNVACAGASAAGSQIADAIGPILNEIVDRFGRGQRVAVDQALSFGNEAINVGARVGNDALERIATQAKNRPMATLAVAIGVGLLIGFAVRRS